MSTAHATIAQQPELPISVLHEFPGNPRRSWGDMDSLAASIAANGVLEPLIVRTRVGDGQYEVIAGARRFRAAKAAGLTTVPVTVREVDDHVALEIAILENLQRHDVHPLDEALGVQRLMAMDAAYTLDAVAARLGKTPRQVRERLQLLNLIPQVREAFEQERITAGHALRLARLTPVMQAEAFERACFMPIFRAADANAEALAPLRDLDIWIEDHVAFDPAEPATRELFEDADAKLATIEAAAADGGTVVLISYTHQTIGKKKGGPRIYVASQWRHAHGKQKCAHAVTGVIAFGPHKGNTEQVCVTRSCTKHFPPPAKTASAETRQDQQARWEYERQLKTARCNRAKVVALTIAKSIAAAADLATAVGLAAGELFRDMSDQVVREAATEEFRAHQFAALTPAEQARALAFLALAPRIGWWSEDVDKTLIALAKQEGVDVAAVQRDAKTQIPDPPKPDAPKKPAAKKAARTTTKKTAAKKKR